MTILWKHPWTQKSSHLWMACFFHLIWYISKTDLFSRKSETCHKERIPVTVCLGTRQFQPWIYVILDYFFMLETLNVSIMDKIYLTMQEDVSNKLKVFLIFYLYSIRIKYGRISFKLSWTDPEHIKIILVLINHTSPLISRKCLVWGR